MVKTCPACEVDFEVAPSADYRVCCSRACSSKYRAAEARKNRPITYCKVCKAQMQLAPFDSKRRGHCSKECQAITYKKQFAGARSVKWKGGFSATKAYHKVKSAESNERRNIKKRDDPSVPLEHEEQSRFVAECARRGEPFSNIFAIPNGGTNNKMIMQVKLKREGRKAGVPDMFLPAAASGFFGCFIEMKRVRGGQILSEQKEWIMKLRGLGYCAIVCRGCDEAMKFTELYLAGRVVGFGEKFTDYKVAP